MQPSHVKFLLAITLIISTTSSVWAKRFSSRYCEFELPSGWECALEGSEYVCQSENADRKKESIIILAAKIRGEQDSMDEYQAYLKKPKEYSLPGGKKQISEPKSTKVSSINGQQWVDSLHLASEVPGFYTRYLATVKEDLGVAVTFSVSKDLYSQYQPIIEKLISTLRVFRQKQGGSELANLRSGNAQDPNFEDTTFNPTAGPDVSMNKTKSRGDDGQSEEDMFPLLAIIIGAAVVFIIMKAKKKKAKPKKKQ
jgi:hypothetical protein